MIIGELVATNPVYLEIIDFFASGTTPKRLSISSHLPQLSIALWNC